jgi:alanine racemase
VLLNIAVSMSATTPAISEDESIRPTRVEVNLGQLGRNLQAVRQHVGSAKVMAVVKANAYGHGLVPVAQEMVKGGADSLGVALLEEAVILREAGITTPILVFGGIAETQIPLFIRHDLTLTAPSIDKLTLIENAAAVMGVTARVHLKIDTGMERLGIHYYSADKLLEASLKTRHVQVEGIYSHFANSDAADLAHAREQLSRFHEVLSFYDKRSLPMPQRHIANSGGILQLPESHLDLVRPGIMLYGVYPSPECARTVPIQPALTWKSHVAYFKVVQPGHPISYGSTWQSDHPVRVVTVPVGYGDGYFRTLSNKGEVLIRGQRYPVAGRVCMDQIMVNIDSGTAYYRDEVILLGRQGESVIIADDLAEWAGTISYEVLTNINSRVPRVYV